MPWKECSVMEARLRFVARLLEGEAMSDLAREFGISRKNHVGCPLLRSWAGDRGFQLGAHLPQVRRWLLRSCNHSRSATASRYCFIAVK